eukprot:TRINITY_DN1866_c0_g1_i1.p1 TRINITY_DN1866_c0_g1~~TRINITY_DN1866_c0_g1_i1.p1  ORF type:complete len:337 (-),score=182.12 TRINITY_DN1866_c0_g1_i1:142-1080(-)
MANETDDLVAFASKFDWKKYVGDAKIAELGKAVQERVKALETAANAPRLKLVAVGDGAVGKTCLLVSYATGRFPEDYVPTVFDNYTAPIEIGDETILLHLWDTAGQEDYDRLRPLSYPGTDVVLLCFSLTSEASYEAVTEKWYPELNVYCSGVPIILIGLKVDLRDQGLKDPHSDSDEFITQEQGQELADDIGAAQYIEVSAKTGKNLELVYETATKLVLKNHAKSSSSGESSSSKKKSSSSSKKKSSSSKEKSSSSKSSSSKSKSSSSKDKPSSSSKSSSSKDKPSSSSSSSSSSSKDKDKDKKKKRLGII